MKPLSNSDDSVHQYNQRESSLKTTFENKYLFPIYDAVEDAYMQGASKEDVLAILKNESLTIPNRIYILQNYRSVHPLSAKVAMRIS